MTSGAIAQNNQGRSDLQFAARPFTIQAAIAVIGEDSEPATDVSVKIANLVSKSLTTLTMKR